jgi:hypothetical protein
MSVLEKGSSNNYLHDYRDGKIKLGLGIGSTFMDKHIRFKQGQFVGVLGGANYGKTYFVTWYFLCLATNHNLKFCLWLDENHKGQIMRNLIQMLANRKYMDLTHEQIDFYAERIEQWFTFVDNMKPYTPNELLDVFSGVEADAYFVDPFNQLNHDMSYSSNIDFIRNLKRWCKTKKKTVYLSMHPVTSAGRKISEYPKGHDWEGHPMMPSKSMAEGGAIFGNMCDDWINVHRLPKMESMKNFTLIDIDKVKDNDTGGMQTTQDEIIMCFFNDGLGFLIDGMDCIKREEKPEAIKPSLDF